MSRHSNQGPILPLPNSNSKTSLYSNHTDQSDQAFLNTKKAIQRSPKKQQTPKNAPIIVSKQASPKPKDKATIEVSTKQQKSAPRLPEVKHNIPKLAQSRPKISSHSFANDAAERYALFNEKMSGTEAKQDNIVRHNLFSVSQSRKDKVIQKYGYSQVREEEKSGKPMLNSGQGSRWTKSQSVALPQENKSFKYLIRHFHKHNSIMVDALHKFWELYEEAERSLSLSKYNLSLQDSLDVIKIKMESYLERQINLENVQQEKPSLDWNQEQYINYYGNYRKILSENVKDQGYHKPYTLKKYKNCVFFGHINDSKKERGILHYFNGKCFEGVFKDDQKDYGLQIDDNELYLGQFRKGVRNGEGILKTSQVLSVGTFTNGQYSITGAQRQSTGASNLFQNNQRPKNGSSQNKKGFEISHSSIAVFDRSSAVVKNSAGDIFIGTLNDEGQKQGQGLQIFANGDLYIGKYESGGPEGYGEYYWENGSNYRGQFLSGMRHGRGIWHMINGDSYEGEYMNDKKNGKGIYIWKNGSKYEGNFENDYRHGYGQMRWQDGRTYKGNWLNGIEKNLLITLEKPPVKNTKNNKTAYNYKPAFRTLQNDNKKRIPLDKLKSIYNPSYQ